VGGRGTTSKLERSRRRNSNEIPLIVAGGRRLNYRVSTQAKNKACEGETRHKLPYRTADERESSSSVGGGDDQKRQLTRGHLLLEQARPIRMKGLRSTTEEEEGSKSSFIGEAVLLEEQKRGQRSGLMNALDTEPPQKKGDSRT